MKKLLLAIFAVFITASIASADITVYLENTSPHTKNYFFYWLNHPFGCTEVNLGATTVIKCDHAWAVGEVKSGKTKSVILDGGYKDVGNKFMICWRDGISNPLNPEKETFHKFTVIGTLFQIHSTPMELTKFYLPNP